MYKMHLSKLSQKSLGIASLFHDVCGVRQLLAIPFASKLLLLLPVFCLCSTGYIWLHRGGEKINVNTTHGFIIENDMMASRASIALIYHHYPWYICIYIYIE